MAYVEDQTLVLPAGVGVTELGALWDCRASKHSGFNLFSDLRPEHVRFNSVGIEDMQLRHFKTTSDKVKGGEAR